MARAETLIDAFCASADAHGDRLAVWAGDEQLTYREVLSQASDIAAALLQAGVVPGDRVGLLCRRSPQAYVAIIAALRAGCVYVPLNPRFPLDRTRAMLEASEATALIIDRANLDRSADLLRDPPPALRAVASFDELDPGAGSKLAVIGPRDQRAVRHPAWPARRGDDLCYLLFTSGTTGVPKGVPIGHANVLAYLDGMSEHITATPDDRLIQLGDLTFDTSTHDIWLAWTSGASIYAVPENATLLASRFVVDHELTGWCSVPSAVGLARKAGLLEAGDLPSLRFSVFGGEALPPMVAEAWAEAAPNSTIYNQYGPTEATCAVSAFRYRAGMKGLPPVVPIGRPMRNQQMVIFDADARPMPAGESGELFIAGNQLCAGYWRNPALDAQKFVVRDGTRWYRTGDLVRWSDEHGFEYLGRMDQQTKILGYRVELLEIEGALRKASGRDLLAVLPWPVTVEGGAEGTVAFVVGAPLDEPEILATLQSALPPYMIPKRFVYVDQLPFNANGKTDYAALRRHPALEG